MKKRVGIDFHVANGIYQGVRTYLSNLVEELVKMENGLTYVTYMKNPENFSDWGNNHSSLVLKKLFTHSGRFNLLLGFPAYAFRDGLSLFHSQYVLPAYLPCKSVLTIHDILFESHPQFFPQKHRRMLKFFIPFSARRAGRIITVSEFTKRQIIHYYGIPEEKVTVIYEGVSDRFTPIRNNDLIQATMKKYKIKKNYILFVGRIEPRKNIAGLLHAFDYVKKRGKRNLCLVVVGQQDRIFKEKGVFDTIKLMGPASDIVFTGGVSDKDLPIIYNGAEVLVYPSFAEGFGLPVLEAMACGTPVITSSATSLPEVVEDAALMVNPYSLEETGEGLERLLDDPALRDELSAKGIERAKTFQWKKSAEKTVQVYKEIMEKSR